MLPSREKLQQDLAVLDAARYSQNDMDIAIARERERCAMIADARASADQMRWKNETDWSQPYAANRVLRASLDIAAAIRNPETGDGASAKARGK